ncbi:MAG: 3-oxoacyl-[acyl-carrier-protein] reductase [PVC group bacterium]|nr:3-oxoacyl-[acyl-carrier-protein] reductase [PVC group bacterium]
MANLKNKTVIITGGSRGIGKACCLAFAQAGANVIFTFSKSKQEADSLEKQINDINANCLAIQSDIKDYEQCREVVVKSIEKFEKIDILVNNAGITKDKALMMMSVEDWKDVIDTNLGGVFNMSRAVITTFLKQKEGCILNMSSISGMVGMPRQTNYSASKAGIIGFSKALAKEVAPYNVRVNTVCPGFVGTDMVDNLQDSVKDNIAKSIPVKRIGDAEEIADLCVFLASEKARYIIGETIKIDGGLAI